MDRLATLDLFVRIVDRGSFTAAAASCGISRPVATATIKALESRLGVRLLQRSTRHVRPTVEGAAYYRRCIAILADLEDADRSVAGGVSGVLRVDVVGYLARTILLPALPDFLARHPALTVHLGEGERFVDLVREGGIASCVRVCSPTAIWWQGLWGLWRKPPWPARNILPSMEYHRHRRILRVIK